jgi:hypothetical protein
MKLSERLNTIKKARDVFNNSSQAPPNYRPAEGEAIFNLATEATSTQTENGLHELSFTGYSGGPVSLRDYGYEYPMIYNIAEI